MFAVQATQFIIFCYSSSSGLREIKQRIHLQQTCPVKQSSLGKRQMIYRSETQDIHQEKETIEDKIKV